MRQRFVPEMPCQYSIVVPMHNEEGNVEPLAARLLQAMDALDESYELIFVDDGSTDRTFATLSRVAQLHPEIRVIKLKRNFGQTPALAAGFDHAAGEIIIAMDGDLRSDPPKYTCYLGSSKKAMTSSTGGGVTASTKASCARFLPAWRIVGSLAFPESPSTISAPPSRPTAAK